MPRPTRTVIPRNFNLDLPVASTSQITNASISAQTKEKVTKKRKLNPAPQVEPEEVVKTVGRVESIQAVKNKQKSGKKAVELIEFETELVEKKSKPVIKSKPKSKLKSHARTPPIELELQVETGDTYIFHQHVKTRILEKWRQLSERSVNDYVDQIISTANKIQDEAIGHGHLIEKIFKKLIPRIEKEAQETNVPHLFGINRKGTSKSDVDIYSGQEIPEKIQIVRDELDRVKQEIGMIDQKLSVVNGKKRKGYN